MCVTHVLLQVRHVYQESHEQVDGIPGLPDMRPMLAATLDVPMELSGSFCAGLTWMDRGHFMLLALVYC